MIYKLISCEQVIAKVLADLDMGEESTRLSDYRNWCGEAVEKIGSVKQFKRKVSGTEGLGLLSITGHQAPLPNDLHKLNHVTFSRNEHGPWMPMTVATTSFNVWSAKDLDIKVPTTVGGGPLEVGLKYSIKPGFIMTNAPEGYLKISYDAIYTDGNGYPMIPDTISCIEAVYWYILMKLKYPEYLSGKMNSERYYDIRRSWNFYCKQAYGESMMPNNDEMETIKNVWTKLIPDVYANESGYANVGEPQTTKNLNRNYGRKYW